MEYLNSTKSALEIADCAFHLAAKKLAELESCLCVQDTLTHQEAERLIGDQGNEVMRLMVQGFLDHRHETEVHEPQRGIDGELRTYLKTTSRALMTTFGPVRVTRVTAYGTGMSGVRPLDDELNLPTTKYSYALQETATRWVAQVSFEQAIDNLQTSTAGHIPKRQLEVLTQAAVVNFDAFYEMSVPEVSSPHAFLVLTIDGKGIVMTPDGLTEQTRKLAAFKNKLRKRAGRLGDSDNTSRKRMASVFSVYDQAPMSRSAEELLKHQGKMPRPQSKRVFATISNDLRTAVGQMFDEAERRDPEHSRKWVVLVDGAIAQKDFILDEAKKRGVEVTVILDIIHAAQYLWTAGHALVDGKTKRSNWIHERLLRILAGEASMVAAGIRRSATNQKLKGQKRADVDRAADYFLKNKDMMRYDVYLAAGCPVATGVIEGACRYLVKDRMDITGAKWGLESAEAVLKLRALLKNDDFDAYWKFHTAVERQRNRTRLSAANDNIVQGTQARHG